jgi:diguanylate cyclase (GGDEF)-like protein/PAS domain S-box-containing protein
VRLAALVDCSTDAIIDSKRDGTITSWNRSAVRLFGYTAAEAVGRNIRMLVPADRLREGDDVRAALEQGRYVDLLRTRRRRKDGTLLEVQLSICPLRDAIGRVAGVSTIVRDLGDQVEVERALREREAGLRRAQKIAKLAHVITRGDGSFESWFEALPELIGRPAEQLPRTTREWLSIIHPDDRAAFRAKSIEAARTGERVELHYRLERGDGSWACMRQDIEPIDGVLDADGKRRWFNTLQDITEYRHSEERIKRLNRLYAVLSGINNLIVRVRERAELYGEVCRIAVDIGAFKLAWVEVIDAPLLECQVQSHSTTSGVDVEAIASLVRPLSSRAAHEAHPVICNDVGGEPALAAGREALSSWGLRSVGCFPITVAGSTVAVFGLCGGDTGVFDDDERRLLVELAGDISFALDHIDKVEQLHHLAYYDALTGLANGTLFDERLPRFLETAQRNDTKLALFLIDIERFKSVNDTLGRHAGDLLLKELGRRLARNPVGVSSVARVGADRFAVVVPDVKQEADIARTLEERMHAWFDDLFDLHGAALRISAKVGVALYPNDGSDPEALLMNAEAALKRAKQSGERCVFFTEEMTARIGGRLALESELRQALQQNEFVLHYQPKVTLDGRRIGSLEALIRWTHPSLGLVPPARFVPLLEETGLIAEVGAWAIRRAVEDQQRWRAEGLPAPRVAVNVSALQLRQANFVDVVRQAIGSAAAAIDIEITESLLMQDIEATIPKLVALRELGVDIAIDDFGTGYSSLAYLAKLPVQALKIDRSFIAAMVDDPGVKTVVATIVSLGHAMRMKVIAEGVETEQQASLLRRLGCDEMQGFLISKPVPREDISAMLGGRGGRGPGRAERQAVDGCVRRCAPHDSCAATQSVDISARAEGS